MAMTSQPDPRALPPHMPERYPWQPGHVQRSLPPMLTVSDVERLAKAGVQVKMEDIVDRVCPDSPKEYATDVEAPGPRHQESSELMKAIWHRMRVNTRAIHSDNHMGGMYRVMPVQAAVRHGDTIHVFVHTGHSPPCIIEDEAVLFPSDALMAKIALLEKVEKGRSYAEENTAPSTGPMQAQAGASGGGMMRRQGNAP